MILLHENEVQQPWTLMELNIYALKLAMPHFLMKMRKELRRGHHNNPETRHPTRFDLDTYFAVHGAIFCSLSGPEEGCRSSSIARKIQDLSGWKQPLKTQENEPHDPCMPSP